VPSATHDLAESATALPDSNEAASPQIGLPVELTEAVIGRPRGHRHGTESSDKMPQAIVDPIELRRFAQNLKKFNQELEERLTSLRAQLHSLGATWRDQEHKKFVEDFDEHMKVIAKYIEATNQHAPYLLRKAERIEEYLQQR
jgi:uncharacterized protein YukE